VRPPIRSREGVRGCDRVKTLVSYCVDTHARWLSVETSCGPPEL
jgi:hypothetical protein